MPIRLLHVFDASQPLGLVRQIRLLNKLLQADECASEMPPKRRYRIDEAVISSTLSHGIANKLHLRMQIRDDSPKLIHAWDWRSLRSVLTAIGLKSNVGIVFSVPEGTVLDWKSVVGLRLIARSSIRFLVSNDASKESLKRARVPPEQVEVIPPGIEGHCQAPRIDRVEFARWLQVPVDARLMLAVGPLRLSSAHQHLIWATGLLRNVDDNVFLAIEGSGSDEWRLRRFCQQIRSGDRIRFLGHRPDIVESLTHFDCFWTACSNGCNSNIVLEAMSRSLNVIASDIEAHRRFVAHEKTGYLVTRGDRGAYARHTWRLLRNPDLSRQMGLLARERALNQFKPDRMLQAYSRLYADLWESVSRPKTRRAGRN